MWAVCKEVTSDYDGCVTSRVTRPYACLRDWTLEGCGHRGRCTSTEKNYLGSIPRDEAEERFLHPVEGPCCKDTHPHFRRD